MAEEKEYRFRDFVYACFEVRKMNASELQKIMNEVPPIDEFWDVIEHVAKQRYQKFKNRDPTSDYTGINGLDVEGS